MGKNASVDIFLRFLNERFEAFREALNELLKALTLEDRAKKAEACKATLGALDELKCALSSSDRPGWIGQLEGRLRWYLNHQNLADAGLTVLNTLLPMHSTIASQKWRFDDNAPAIDFDAIYQEYYTGSRVPELFDELVGHLETIIKAGEIDSIQTIKALEKLIATIRKNSRGDYFATRGAWEFTQIFFRNLSIELLENIPGLKHAVKAVRKTMAELDLEMSQVHDQVSQKLLESMKEELPMLKYKPLALPSPPENGSVAESQLRTRGLEK